MNIDDELIVLMLFYHMKAKKKDKKLHSRYKKIVYKSLSRYQKRIRYNRIPRLSLQDASDCAWSKLYASNNDQALITLTGLYFSVFRYLASKFKPLFNAYSPWVDDGTGKLKLKIKANKSRPRLISAAQCLGLNLAWTRTRRSLMALQLIFGMSFTLLHVYIRFRRRILIEILKKDPASAIKVPCPDKIKECQDAIKARHPRLKKV